MLEPKFSRAGGRVSEDTVVLEKRKWYQNDELREKIITVFLSLRFYVFCVSYIDSYDW